MNKTLGLVWPALLLGGCLMSRLELGPATPQGDEGGEAGTPGDTQVNGGRSPGGAGQAGDTSLSGESTGGVSVVGGTPSTGGVDAIGGDNTGGSLGPNGGSGGMSGTGGANTGGSAGSGGSNSSITDVWKSSGCNKAYNGNTGTTPITLDTWGQKDAACADKLLGAARCGVWGQAGSTWLTTPLPRDYYVTLPTGYDSTKAYPLVLEGPGCGGNGKPGSVYTLPDLAATAIRLGWTPPPNSIGHGSNENQNCFDDHEGDDSVDFVFWEKLYDKLESELCFDRNRVFVGGNSSGSWIANEMACKYSGDANRPIRAVLANTGGLPTDPKWVPKCTTAPMAGMWVHETGDPDNPFTGNKVAINRAMSVNGCTGADNYDAAVANNELANYPIAGNTSSTCKKILNCPADYPLVVCALPGMGHGLHDSVVNPGFAKFVTDLMAP